MIVAATTAMLLGFGMAPQGQLVPKQRVVADLAIAQRRGVGTGSLIPGRSSGLVTSGLSDAVAMDLRAGPQAERMRFYRRAATCAVSADGPKVQRYLDSFFAGRYDSREWRDFRDLYEDCFDTRGNTNGLVIPGDGRYLWLAAVNAEAYIRNGNLASVEAVPIESLYTDASFQALPTGASKKLRCVVRTQPAKALALIESDAGSAEENKAIAALVPAIGACTDSGATVAMSRVMLRLNAAPAYYTLAMQRHDNPAAETN